MFELLFIHWNVNPVIFQIGSFGLRWYSILFVSGFILGWFIFRWFFRREGVSEDLLDSLLYTLLIGTIVGARLGHCIFYQPEYYFGSWQGFFRCYRSCGGFAVNCGVGDSEPTVRIFRDACDDPSCLCGGEKPYLPFQLRERCGKVSQLLLLPLPYSCQADTDLS